MAIFERFVSGDVQRFQARITGRGEPEKRGDILLFSRATAGPKRGTPGPTRRRWRRPTRRIQKAFVG
jgi:hypothetical protein